MTSSNTQQHGLGENLAMVALGTCGAYITVLLAAIVPQWIAAGIPGETANYIVSAEKAGMALSSLGLTAVINKWNRRRMAIAFLLALGATNALTAQTVSPGALGALRFLCGISEGGVISLMTAAAVGAGTADRISASIWLRRCCSLTSVSKTSRRCSAREVCPRFSMRWRR